MHGLFKDLPVLLSQPRGFGASYSPLAYSKQGHRLPSQEVTPQFSSKLACESVCWVIGDTC